MSRAVFFPIIGCQNPSPIKLQVAFRYAFVDPNISQPNDLNQEYTFIVNWFFAGHRNKLTFDTSRLTLENEEPDGTGKLSSVQRFRLQWDISF